MKNLRKRFNRFCFVNRDKGIPNLMLYISLGSALVYFMNIIDQSRILYSILCFSRQAILHGQIWRLFTYPLVFDAGNPLLTILLLFCYFSLGRAVENVWGTFRFNLFYLTGIVLMDIYGLIFGAAADVSYLNLSLLLAYATLYPNATFLILFIIPVKAWFLALIYFATILYGLFAYPFPYNLFTVIALANYFLFFGSDVLNVFPASWRMNFRRLFHKAAAPKKYKTVPFPTAGSYEATTARPKAPYNHRCTVCGRTDISDPQLEFRYCSRCNGYYCYCEEHISNHTHIQ